MGHFSCSLLFESSFQRFNLHVLEWLGPDHPQLNPEVVGVDLLTSVVELCSLFQLE